MFDLSTRGSVLLTKSAHAKFIFLFLNNELLASKEFPIALYPKITQTCRIVIYSHVPCVVPKHSTGILDEVRKTTVM